MDTKNGFKTDSPEDYVIELMIEQYPGPWHVEHVANTYFSVRHTPPGAEFASVVFTTPRRRVAYGVTACVNRVRRQMREDDLKWIEATS